MLDWNIINYKKKIQSSLVIQVDQAKNVINLLDQRNISERTSACGDKVIDKFISIIL